MDHLIRLHETYNARAAFLFIAIRDAGHRDPKWSFLSIAPDAAPEERVRVIRKGLEFYKIPFHCLIDEDKQVERAYGAYPLRLVIVGSDGRVVFDAGRGSLGGPSAWDLEEVEGHLRSVLH